MRAVDRASPRRTRMQNGNRFKLGLFGMNCSGSVPTTVPERWRAGWPEIRKAALLADEAGLEFQARRRRLAIVVMRRMKERVICGGATFPVIGSYDEVAQKFLQLAEAGLDGMALILVNYVKEMPILRDEVLPRLERLTLRAGHGKSARRRQ